MAAGQKLPNPAFYVLDDVDYSRAWDEEALFHCFNRCASETGGILLSQMPVGQMNWQLPDLRSRMHAVNLVQIDLPDDNLLFALLNKYFCRSTTDSTTGDAILPYSTHGAVIRRCCRLAAALDHRSIAEKPLSVALARNVLDDFL